MKRKLLYLALAMVTASIYPLSASAQIPDGYYSSLKGKKGAELKNAIYNIVKKANVLEYGSGSGKTWSGFWVTDRNSAGYYIDRYSAESAWVKSTSQGATGSGMNIEHSFPKSWWGKTKNQAYKDLYNLMPCESGINSKKSNYPMGAVTGSDNGNGWTKVGTGADGQKYWEPADSWKGDFARGYMYMATTYQTFTWTGEGLQILEQGTYPTLQKWAYTLFIKWARTDKPDALEIKRNNDVYGIQGNRNPYVDFPNLMEYVWGDSTDVAFNPETSVKSTDYNNDGGDVTPDDPDSDTILDLDFTTSEGGCTKTIDKNEGTNEAIWIQTSSYGWKATAYVSSTKTNYAADATLTLPEIDLTDYKDAKLTINQAINFAKGNALKYLSVLVFTSDPEEGDVLTKLSDFSVPSTDSWTFADYTLDLSQFCGNKATIKFRYTSDATICSTWEIKYATVTGTKITNGIEAPTHSCTYGGIDMSQPYDTYTVDGRKTTLTDSSKGIFILKQGNRTRKIARF